ncbi:hypothetical protein Pdw03_5048 [Penicillium digitatum]|uniref:Uncharacterized protein n=1 Tax=Penicillium digitatum TaxID=36651 RepID=A0A7T6XJD0_PENDI|nr:hypothetical protein Pdw03_5048 [Penicillium digitatum]
MLDGRDIQPRAITDEISQYLDSDTVSDELEAAKEEREEKLSEIEVDPISDTEEQEDELEDKPGDAIEVTQYWVEPSDPDPLLGRRVRPKTQPRLGWVWVGSGFYWVVRKTTRDHPDQWFEYCRRAYDYIETTQSEATNARERVDQAELQLQAARIKITRLSSELTAAERDHLRDVAVLEYQKKLYDEAQQNIARIEAARMCAAELAIPTGNTVPPPVPEPAAEPGVAAAMGTPPSLTPESSGSHRLAMEGEMHNEALPTMLEQAINREMKGMLLHHEPPKGDYLDLARFLQNLENRRVQYDSGPSTAPRTYSAAIRTAPKAPELNSGRPGPEQALPPRL